ncbi:MAG: ribonuclease R [Clostridiales Family XIII bacterium]|jgi:ribonuclease R|nr:ribonuclease R [Clostridiales Family XIII bacterium]
MANTGTRKGKPKRNRKRGGVQARLRREERALRKRQTRRERQAPPERPLPEFVGLFNRERDTGPGSVTPYDRGAPREIRIAQSDFGGASPGDKVLVRLTKRRDAAESAEGRVIEIIAAADAPGGDILAAVKRFGLSKDFPQKVEAEAGRVGQSVSESECAGRRDLRGERIFTIDGADAKDFDDAVSVRERAGGGWVLGVHIADVSHYVKDGSRLDKEALQRGTSIYLLDQVVPMLPVSLSNGICSLNEGLDRLTLSVDISIDADGEVLGHTIYESVIRSKARLVYTDISDLLETDNPALKERYAEIHDDLLRMAALARQLQKRREARGSIDFDLDEAKISLDESGIPVLVSVAERRTANRMIEEFMLLANECVAEEYCRGEFPFVYRVHERPDAERMTEFKTFIGGFGLTLKGDPANVRPAALNELLSAIKDKPYENVVNTVTLRSMQKASYSAECRGHFGLALRYYCHFTSPIRRYPDLFVHRIIKENLRGGVAAERRGALREKAETAALRSSETERRAIELERDVEKRKKAEYMSYRIGECHDAVISGVSSFGFFAGLANTVEGLVHMNTLTDDYYIYDPAHYRLVGERRGRVFALGDTVRIRVEKVDIGRREIDFVLEP